MGGRRIGDVSGCLVDILYEHGDIDNILSSMLYLPL